MGFDLFQSRRGYNERCAWWTRNENDDLPPNEITMRRNPNGYFMAREENPETKRENSIYNTYMVEKTTIIIKTPDNINGIRQKDVVSFRGEYWVVVSVQKTKARIQQSEMADDQNRSHYWYLELRK